MDKRIKNSQLSKANIGQLYCFPDIILDDTLKTEKHIETESNFRRISFEDNSHTSSANFKVGNIENTTMKKEKAGDMKIKAYNEGFAQGEEAGIVSGKKQLEPVLNNFRQALLELSKLKKELYMNVEKETVTLALAIAKKIICHEVKTNKEVVVNVLREASKKVVDNEKIKVRINPSDLKLIEKSKFRFLNSVDNSDNISFEADDTILHGGCIIETNFGDIDARLEKQFQVIEKAFKSEFKKLEYSNQ